MTKCMVMGCENEAIARGRCNTHHAAWLRKTPHQERPDVSRPLRRHAKLVGLFGGVRPFCRAVGIDPTTFYRWKEAVPEEMRPAIREGAARAGIDVAAVRAVLDHG